MRKIFAGVSGADTDDTFVGGADDDDDDDDGDASRFVSGSDRPRASENSASRRALTSSSLVPENQVTSPHGPAADSVAEASRCLSSSSAAATPDAVDKDEEEEEEEEDEKGANVPVGGFFRM